MKGDRERCLESGMDDYLSKPIRTHELDEILSRNFSDDDEAKTDANITTLIDWSEALSAVDGDCELLKVVAGALLEEVDSLKLRLAAALASGDATSVQQLGHTLKGAVGAIGAQGCRCLAERLESLGKQGEIEMAHICFVEFERELGRVCELLQGFVQGDFQPESAIGK
ncbi:Hpt domain-containing protein, partial [Schlesneria sp.]